MRISDWSSDVCSSDLAVARKPEAQAPERQGGKHIRRRAGLLRRQPFGVAQSCLKDAEEIEKPDDEHDRRFLHDREDRKSVVEGKGLSVRVIVGGRRSLKKKKTQETERLYTDT